MAENTDPNIEPLREAGHDDAADLLEQKAMPARSEDEPQRVTLLAASTEDAQRRREGDYLVGEMRAAGIGGGWISGGELMDRDR